MGQQSAYVRTLYSNFGDEGLALLTDTVSTRNLTNPFLTDTVCLYKSLLLADTPFPPNFDGVCQ